MGTCLLLKNSVTVCDVVCAVASQPSSAAGQGGEEEAS